MNKLNFFRLLHPSRWRTNGLSCQGGSFLDAMATLSARSRAAACRRRVRNAWISDVGMGSPGNAGARPWDRSRWLRFESRGFGDGEPGQGQLFVYNILDQESSLLGRYDAVLLLDVLEHIDDDAAFLRAALRHLRSGGIVAVNVPASMMFFSDYDRVAGT